MEIKDYLNQYNKLKNIKRFSMEVTNENQNLCDHGYNVGVLFYLLCNEEGMLVTAESLFLVMNHDFVETYTGDINRRVKEKTVLTKKSWDVIEGEVAPLHLHKYKDTNLKIELSERGFLIFQLADEIDAMMYCKRELESGNSHINTALNHYVGLVKERLSYTSLNWEVSLDGNIHINNGE